MTVIVVKIAEKDKGVSLPNTAINVSSAKLFEVFDKKRQIYKFKHVDGGIIHHLSNIKTENTEIEINSGDTMFY